MLEVGLYELWKPVPIEGFCDLYKISTLGRVKRIGTYNSCKKGILTPMTDTSGYKHVRLYNKGFSKDFSVHRLVALAFIPNPNNYKYVNHIDEDITNNKVTNLEWCTNSYNLSYSVGKKVAQYTKSGILIKVFNCLREASEELHIPITNISKCCKGKRLSAGKYIWKYV